MNNINDFNKFLRTCCELSGKRRISGKLKTVEESWEEECLQLQALPPHGFSTQEIRTSKANDKSLVSFASNYYSLPTKLIGKEIELHINSVEIKCFYKGIGVACHIRLYGTHETSMKLDHYLDLLKYKPGAFKGSLVLEQTKKRDEWPLLYDELWRNLKENLGESKGTQMLIEILLLSREFGQEKVLSAVNAGLLYGCCDKSSILVLIRQQTISYRPPLLEDIGYLKQYERPIRDLGEYNKLLMI